MLNKLVKGGFSTLVCPALQSRRAWGQAREALLWGASFGSDHIPPLGATTPGGGLAPLTRILLTSRLPRGHRNSERLPAATSPQGPHRAPLPRQPYLHFGNGPFS